VFSREESARFEIEMTRKKRGGAWGQNEGVVNPKFFFCVSAVLKINKNNKLSVRLNYARAGRPFLSKITASSSS